MGRIGSSDPTGNSREVVRTHVVLPPELIAEVDQLVGHRRRSQFFLEAAAEKLARLKLARSAAKVAGGLTPLWWTGSLCRYGSGSLLGFVLGGAEEAEC